MIRRYCDEDHDILTTLNVFEALQARRVKETTAVVCEIDRKQGIKVNHISTFCNFSYGADRFQVSKAYNIGPGKLISWSDLNVRCPGLITVKEADEWMNECVCVWLHLDALRYQGRSQTSTRYCLNAKDLAALMSSPPMMSCKIILTLENTD